MSENKTVTVDDPENFAKWLVACLGADKGVSATAEPAANNGVWIVKTATLWLTIIPRSA